MKRLTYIIGIGILLTSCKIKKDSAKTETKQEVEVKIEYKTKDSLIYQSYIEYIPYYDTITKTLYVYPKYEKVNISQNKATESKKDSIIVISTKEQKKSVTKAYYSLIYKLIGIGVIILVIIWYWQKIKKFFSFL
jgi:hypothetical protein